MRQSLVFTLGFLLLAIQVAAQDASALIAQGDSLYEQRADLSKAKSALEKYKGALARDPRSYDACWKTSRMLYFIGCFTTEGKQKIDTFYNGITYAKKAIEIDPRAPDGHYWLGVSYAKYGEARGILRSLFLVDDVKEEMRKVMAVDETYEGGGPHRVLGRVYFKIPGIAGGSNRKSREHLEKARQLCSTNTLTLLYLAETYWDMDMEKEAIQTLETLLAMPPDSRWVPETADDKIQAAKLLEKYKK